MSTYSSSPVARKIITICNKIIDLFLVFLVIGMSLVVLIQVLFRYVFVSPLSWPEETTRLMLVWLSFLGGYVALRENQHMSFMLLIKKIAQPYRVILEIVREISIIIFLIVIVIEGTRFSLKFHDVSFTYINISLGIFAYSVFPIAGTCMLCKSVVNFWDLISTTFLKKEKEKA